MTSVSLNQAQQFLRNHFSTEPQRLRMIGEGAWSRCFGYHVKDQEYAIRFGRYIEDFQKDRWAARFSSAQLPIPEVFEVGEGLCGYFAISRRAHGIPLENVVPEVWQVVIPDLVNILEALRTADLKETAGVGIGTKMAPPIVLIGGSICSLLLKTKRPNALTVGIANWNRILLQAWMPLSEVWIS